MQKYHRDRFRLIIKRIIAKDKAYQLAVKLWKCNRKLRWNLIRTFFVNTFYLRNISADFPFPAPRVLNIFVSNRCNCDCKYCFVKGTHQEEMSDELLDKVLTEAEGFNTLFICLSGGEPLMRESLFEHIRKHSGLLFLLFTNGLKMDEKTIGEIADAGNVIPIFSLDGFEKTTSRKRSPSVWAAFEKASRELQKHRIIFGYSCHTEQDNFDESTSREFIETMEKYGCTVGWYSLHIPMSEYDVNNKVLRPEQRIDLLNRLEIQREKAMILIDSASDSRFLGSCSAGGNVLIHIEANGDICPCQFLPFSVGNIKNMSILDAVKSKFFCNVRELGKMKCCRDNIAGCIALDKRRDLLNIISDCKDDITNHSRNLAEKWSSYQLAMDDYEKSLSAKIDAEVEFRS